MIASRGCYKVSDGFPGVELVGAGGRLQLTDSIRAQEVLATGEAEIFLSVTVSFRKEHLEIRPCLVCLVLFVPFFNVLLKDGSFGKEEEC